MSLKPFPAEYFTLKNTKFVLRALVRQDREMLAGFASEFGEELRAPFPMTHAALLGKKSSVAGFVRQKLELFEESKGLFCVIQKLETAEMVGFVSAFQFEWRTPKCEISWMVSSKFARHGIAAYCSKRLIQYLQLQGLQKTICRISPENAASIGLAEKLGFVREGLHRRDFRDGNDNLLDVLYFGKLF